MHIAGFGDIALQDLAFMIDGAPKIMLDPVYLHKDLVQVPLPLRVLAHVGSSFRPDLASEDWTKAIAPKPHALVANINASLVEQVFNIAKRE